MSLPLLEAPVALPRVRSVPDYAYSTGEEAIKLADSVGLHLDPWQRSAVLDIMAERADGRWSTFEAGLVVPRQNGKGAILEAVELADLFLIGAEQPDFLVIHTAHEFKTAREAFRRLLRWIENTPWMDRKVARKVAGNNEQSVELHSGARIQFLARSGDSGRGFSADRLIYDEAYNLSKETIAASLPTLSARMNPQVLYTSSAPLDHEKSVVLREVMRRGRQEPEGRDAPTPEPDRKLCYIEFSADPKSDLDDVAAWEQSNPGIASGRNSVEMIENLRSAMSEVQFAREILGILDESKGAAVIDPKLWADAGDVLSTMLDPVAFAIDVNPDSSFSSIAVAGRRADGLMHTEVVDRRKGTGWVVDRVAELVERWKTVSVTLDAVGPAGALVQRFAAEDVAVDIVSTREYGQACQGFKNLVDDGELRHKEQPGLTAALESARKRPLGDTGAWGWHRRDTTDITPLVACTLATFGFAKAAGGAVDNSVVVFR
jgi:phage terminase large subunit-like protein